MQLYPKPSSELVFDLLNKANTGLTEPLTTANVILQVPKVIANAPAAGPNTKVIVSGKRAGKYRGSKELTYNRIDVSSLFKNVAPIVIRYMASGDGGPLANHIDAFNEKYGLKLTEDDFAPVTFPLSSIDPIDGKRTGLVTVTMKPTSLAYVGAFPLRWKQGNRELNSVVTSTELASRAYPGGNVFDANHPFIVDIDGYGEDYTAFWAETFPYQGGQLPFTQAFANGYRVLEPSRSDLWPAHKQIIARLAEITGTPYFADETQSKATKYNLFGAVFSVVGALPSTLFPLANSKDFTKLIVITPAVENTWAVGNIYLHHNTGL